MIVEEIMSTDVHTLTAEATIKEAMEMLAEFRIRQIPIVNENYEVIGIVTDRDIRDASPSIFHSEEHLEDLQNPVSAIMERNVITSHPLDFVEEISSLFYEHKIGCLPICDDDKLIGIVTETDILHTLVQLMGAHQPSSQIEIRVENITGKLSDIAKIFKNLHVSITSVLVYPCKDISYKILVFRVQTMDTRALISEIEKEGYEVVWPSMPSLGGPL